MGSSIKRDFGRQVKKLREKAGLTQATLAELTGIDYKYIQKIEGKSSPDLRLTTIEKIAKALKMTCAKLLDF